MGYGGAGRCGGREARALDIEELKTDGDTDCRSPNWQRWWRKAAAAVRCFGRRRGWRWWRLWASRGGQAALDDAGGWVPRRAVVRVFERNAVLVRWRLLCWLFGARVDGWTDRSRAGRAGRSRRTPRASHRAARSPPCAAPCLPSRRSPRAPCGVCGANLTATSTVSYLEARPDTTLQPTARRFLLCARPFFHKR